MKVKCGGCKKEFNLTKERILISRIYELDTMIFKCDKCYLIDRLVG